MDEFGNRLKHLRTQAHFTQAELAKKLGLTKSVISAYETRMRMPSYEILLKTAELFHVSTDYLLGAKQTEMLDLSGLSEEEIAAVRTIIHSMKLKK
ncbi:MAG: helix-turn-helix transcriptional regulator [Clostridia bacterium]|nr:helix-turn-helix transcriptional regulator [Clostridia bacterium]